MASWLKSYEATCGLPRLWVERVWLLESREPLVTLRVVSLKPGVNVVWAREPDSEEESGLASAGHGVGKTSFCLLLRYVLGDDATAISALREKAVGNFSKGGVAAKVHIDGVVWLVFRPFGTGPSIAKQCSDLEEALAGRIDGEFSRYLDALQTAFIGKLAIQTLPGTNQVLEWRHLLAWCIREQRTRFDGFFHWRDADGLGFRRSRQDPPLFVNAVLGLLDGETDRLMRAVELAQTALEDLTKRIPELEREPIYALTQLERQLRLQVGADEDEPLMATTAGSSLETRAQQVIADAVHAEERWEHESATAQEALEPLVARHRELQAEHQRLELEQGAAKALVDANEGEYTRLISALAELDRLVGLCSLGQVEFSSCEHIQARKATTSLRWSSYELEAQTDAPHLQARLNAASIAAKGAHEAVQANEKLLNGQRASIRRLLVRSATSAVQREQLKDQWTRLMLLHRQRQEGTDSPELVREKGRETALKAALERHESELAQMKLRQSTRADAIKALTRCLAEQLLKESGHGRFVPDSDSRPFDLSVGGEAYQVLEVLLGDVTCLLDAAVTTGSNHPGFLVHDCPREADMSAGLYKNFLLMLLEADEQLNSQGKVAFQYIVTTTSPPPAQLCAAPYLALELQPGADEYLLFKRQLTTSLPGFD